MKKALLIIFFFTIQLNIIGQNHKEITNKYLNSTVTIFLDNSSKSGSGFIVEKGKIVTNLHVIDGNKDGYVIINGTDVKHKIEGYFDYDSTADLVILSIPTLEGEPLTLANEKPKIGDKVFAFENPILSSKTILEGKIDYTSNSISNGVVKTSIPLNQGNSGGALINSKGQVIGVVNGAIISDIENLKAGIGIPVSFLKKLLRRKNETEKKLDLKKGAYYFISESQLKYNIKDYQGALSDLNKSIELNPNIYISYYNRGKIKLKLNDFKGSISDCNKAIEIIPNFVLAYYVRAFAKIKIENYEGAIDDFNRLIEIDNDFALAYNGRGLVKGKLKDFTGAINDFDKAINIEPKNCFFYVSRGGFKFFSGFEKEGCQDFEKAEKLGFTDAQKFIDKNCKHNKTAKEYFDDAVLKENNKNYKGAIADYDKSLEINPKSVKAYNNRGNVKSSLKDYKGAISDFNKAIAINPKDVFAYCNRGIVKTKMKNYDGAISDFNKAISIDSKDISSYMARGMTQHLSGNKIEACSDWLKAGKLGYKRAYLFIEKYCD
ncbi:tetratricopeptide repeat protein [Psychroflexus sp. CAK57W]|uniref:tetratricopeptide repeat protein n=1 Tax=Psychroflexus curvus TaxID=2873595 RepID=UPI001CCC2B83|nr:tetratricopeptide repeat protein [Psychroflexus curvus]MBZ9786995.1 tetratricopeptide repeat protein [Psychroflexus curvus]